MAAHDLPSDAPSPLLAFADLWRDAAQPPDLAGFIESHPQLTFEEILELIRFDFQQRRQIGLRPNVELYLGQLSPSWQNTDRLTKLIDLELAERTANGEQPQAEEYRARFPELSESLFAEILDETIAMDREPTERDQIVATPDSAPSQAQPTSASVTPAPAAIPERVGRYLCERKLGEGAFGEVFVGFDADLDRRVAIKRAKLDSDQVSGADLAELRDMFLREARLLAGLEHPAIVPVYDVGTLPDAAVYIISKYVEGPTLGEQTHRSSFTPAEAANTIASIAEGLAHVHAQGIVHRDIKPSNILLEHGQRPVLVDFGLALEDRQFGSGPRLAGTLRYMSPEQASGRTHVVDGRSDIYSLGAVFYELLTGKPVIRSESSETLREILDEPPRPPRQLRAEIPNELERICLKCLAKNPHERYWTAADLASDLRQACRPTSPLPPSSYHRRPRLVYLAGGLIATALVLVILGVWLTGGFRSAGRGMASEDMASEDEVPEVPVESPSAQAPDAPPSSAQESPRLQQLRLFRQSRLPANDPQLETLLLIVNGNPAEFARLAPFAPGEGLRLEGEFRRSAKWYLLLFEPDGNWFVVERVEQATRTITFPNSAGDAPEILTLNEDTKAGVHLLLLVACTADEKLHRLEKTLPDQLSSVRMIDRLPAAWTLTRSSESEDFLTMRSSPFDREQLAVQTPLNLLQTIENMLPDAHQTVHAIYFDVQP